MYNRPFGRRVYYPGSRLHWYWQPNSQQPRQNTPKSYNAQTSLSLKICRTHKPKSKPKLTGPNSPVTFILMWVSLWQCRTAVDVKHRTVLIICPEIKQQQPKDDGLFISLNWKCSTNILFETGTENACNLSYIEAVRPPDPSTSSRQRSTSSPIGAVGSD